MSLIDLAKQKKLPVHQYMDRKTLDWIIKNQPPFRPRTHYQFSDSLSKRLEKYIPLRDWFLSPEEISSIHGFRHLLRTAACAIQLRESLVEKMASENNLAMAAVLHDIRRLNSKGDLGHGERAARWFLDNIKKIIRETRVRLTRADKEEIYCAIYYHEIPYDDIIKKLAYKKHKNAIDILKTADALDRYRQPKIEWWINDKYLALVPSAELKKFTYDLVVTSETIFLEKDDNVKSIFKALERLKT